MTKENEPCRQPLEKRLFLTISFSSCLFPPSVLLRASFRIAGWASGTLERLDPASVALKKIPVRLSFRPPCLEVTRLLQ